MVELMLVVAIIAILAIVVVPSFMKETTKAKRRTEVNAMFAEIATKQEQFKIEKGNYAGNLSGTNYVGTTACPTSVPTADYVFATSCATTGSLWLTLRVVSPESKVRCQYKVTTNVAGTNFTPPTGFKNSQGVLNTAEPTIASGWWYLLAECDERGNGGTNAQYFMSSIDRKLQYRNEGN
jgi:Tfp pilus assembly protein PilE